MVSATATSTFRTTFGTLITASSRLLMARRRQRALTAILLVILFFTCFTLFTHHQQLATTHHQSSGGNSYQHGMPFLRPSSYLMNLKHRGRGNNNRETIPTFDNSDSEGFGVGGDGARFGGKQRQQRRTGAGQPDYGFSAPERPVVRNENGWRHRPPLPPLRLDPSEELAALIHFITAIPSNAITDVDPNEPIPAELLLGFNTRSGDRAKAELDNVVQSTWFEHPVVIFSLVHSPKAREVKKIVDSYKLAPVPVIFEVDERRDAEIITSVLHRLTNSPTLPILLVGGKSAGTVEEIQAAHQDGSLKWLLADAGAVIGAGEKKKKKKLVVQYSDDE